MVYAVFVAAAGLSPRRFEKFNQKRKTIKIVSIIWFLLSNWNVFFTKIDFVSEICRRDSHIWKEGYAATQTAVCVRVWPAQPICYQRLSRHACNFFFLTPTSQIFFAQKLILAHQYGHSLIQGHIVYRGPSIFRFNFFFFIIESVRRKWRVDFVMTRE